MVWGFLVVFFLVSYYNINTLFKQPLPNFIFVVLITYFRATVSYKIFPYTISHNSQKVKVNLPKERRGTTMV